MTHPTVVLLHGYAANRFLVSRIARHLRKHGYRAINWGYTSWFRPIAFHSQRLRNLVDDLDRDPSVETIHFVTHSMGCIVTRVALLDGLPNKCGRWVMVAPPNKGSHVANRIPAMLRAACKPLEELRSTQDSYVNRLPPPTGIDFGVIQATRDYIVAESLTYVENEKDRIIVPGLHSQILFRPDVAAQCQHFINNGHFALEQTPETAG